MHSMVRRWLWRGQLRSYKLLEEKCGREMEGIVVSKNHRELIIDTSIELFKEYGYHEVTVNEICSKAGISRSSFYSFFPSKLDTIRYVLDSVKRDLNADALQQLIMEENDFERMVTICFKYMQIALDYGPKLMASLFSLEMERQIEVFNGIHATDDWFIQLCKNAQRAGIIRNQSAAESLAPLAVDMELHVTYQWCKDPEHFPLLEKAREAAETFFDIADEYRKSNK